MPSFYNDRLADRRIHSRGLCLASHERPTPQCASAPQCAEGRRGARERGALIIVPTLGAL
eukprot:6176746-Pleurochrysis_carterae.AAC.2